MTTCSTYDLQPLLSAVYSTSAVHVGAIHCNTAFNNKVESIGDLASTMPDHGNGTSICGFVADNEHVFGSFNFRAGAADVSDAPFQSLFKENATLFANWVRKGADSLLLLSGGTLNIRSEDTSRSNVTHYTVVVDMKVPPKKLLAPADRASAATLIPLFHLGADPHERVAVGFAQYHKVGQDLRYELPFWTVRQLCG